MSFRSERTLASAGSGKTYRLVGRFIGLMATGCEPARICALTFTRKAAGEFFDAILRRLAKAASDNKAAATLADEIATLSFQAHTPDNRPLHALGCEDFRKLLRQLIEAMPRLRLGTIDSFCIQMVQALALDLGFNGSFSIVQGYERERRQREILRDVYEGRQLKQSHWQAFLEAYKQATFGLEAKGLKKQIEQFIDQLHESFASYPNLEHWRQEPTRWHPQLPKRLTEGEFETLLAGLHQRILDHRLHPPTEKNFQTLHEFLLYLAARRSKPIPAGLRRALEAKETDGKLGPLVVGRGKQAYTLDEEEHAIVAALLDHLCASAIQRQAQVTAGIGSILEAYEREYAQHVRKQGVLTFADLPWILREHTLSGLEEAGERALEGALGLAYRLDGQIDHWLFDEFQDTSRVQWEVFAELVDEVLADPEAGRTFFYVGDIKQSLYGWRGGAYELFDEIMAQYPGRLHEAEALHRSYRSFEPLLKPVNQLFGNPSLLAYHFSEASAERWAEHWSPHESAHSDGEQLAYASLTCLPYVARAPAENKYEQLLHILQETRPHERGLSCAILARTNKAVQRIVDYLREQSEGTLPVVGALDVQIALDNAAGPLLCSLLRFLEHPGDKLARGHIRLSPLKALAEDEGWRMDCLERWSSLGTEATLRFFTDKLLRQLSPEDAFTRRRLAQMLEAARLYDAEEQRNIDDFIDFLLAYTVRDRSAESVIQVMSIHKSKGLGFDMVLVTGLENSSRGGNEIRLASFNEPPDEALFALPSKVECQLDPLLAKKREAMERMRDYDSLCTLYVAMTRAKRALYLVVQAANDKKAGTCDHRRLLIEGLATEEAEDEADLIRWEAGNRQWYQEALSAPAKTVEAPHPLPPDRDESTQPISLQRRTPSSEGHAAWQRLPSFTVGATDPRDLGNLVHGALEFVPRLDAKSRKQAIDWIQAQEQMAESSRKQAVAQVLSLLESEAGKAIFETDADEVWCERAFEIVLDGAWYSGVIDRAHLWRDAKGVPMRAAILDYKTDRLQSEAVEETLKERYAAQLETYRRVLQVVLELEAEQISLELVSVGHCQRVIL